jgi:hypothetical protein
MLVASTAVPTTRVCNAAPRILRERTGHCPEAEEGRECKYERDFHDVDSMIQLRTPQPILSVIGDLTDYDEGFHTAHARLVGHE